MDILWMVLGIAAGVAALILLTCFICFYMAFFVTKPKSDEEFSLPPGEIYEPYRDIMINWMKEVRNIPHRDVSVKSFDGLTLKGKFYEYKDGAPIELMMHGYRGEAERDLCGGVQRCFALGRSALIVDQRACGDSQGRVISFGINEHRDCLRWIEFLNKEYSGRKIILTGISMGASTVLIAAAQELPENVIAVQADCGFSTAKDIIKKTIKEMKLPADLLYPFVKLGARIYGRFDLEETTSLDSVKKCKLPILLLHGESDDYVPCEMSRINYDAVTGEKMLFTVPGAGHGLCYLVDPEGYMKAFREFSAKIGLPINVEKQ